MRYIITILISLIFIGCQKESNSVTIYVSEDQVFSEPILKEFQKETGIKVNAIYDTEESKSTGVMNRLIAEKNNPQADVYWANEPIRAEVLKQKGILAPYESPNAKGIPNNFRDKRYYWTGFSARVRLFIVQKGLKDRPHSIMAYSNPNFRGKAVIANPLFGTTTAHISALFTIWGEDKGKKFLQQLKANRVKLSTSNGESADFVAHKSYLFSLVDSDDAISRLKAKEPIEIVYPDQDKDEVGAFVVPNAVMLIKNSPHQEMGKKLIDYLLSKKSEERLAFADCAQIPLHKNVPMPSYIKPLKDIKVMPVDFEKVAKEMIAIQPYLKKWVEER